MVELSSRGLRVGEIAEQLRCATGTVRQWLKRFNAKGLEGLRDEPRPGKPPKYTAEQVGEVIAASLTKPEDLGLPFACWTLDRLTAHLHEEKGIPISRSRIDEILSAEGLRWRQQESWFGERADPDFAEKGVPVDPEFAAKRGQSQACIQRPLKAPL